ncbi:unnamed protein product [Acanthoscelides obtectus]|uniref:Uncharacterized protein n=1 Tax=Acanthoscelides obtectus TaxID=200917 RepID=A0A9P0KZU7_ACAOB|nr:unnamed protein product [Acanthoscelides obtectus]CAK1681884.1 hypothetical protein AOBTE_LOCUS33320 [Acanthoscelides obtectus]
MLKPPVKLYRQTALIDMSQHAVTCSLLRPFVKSHCKTLYFGVKCIQNLT